MTQDIRLLGEGLYFEEMPPGLRCRSIGRTITEADITNFVGVTGMVEVLFTNVEYLKKESILGGRPAPGALVFSIAEGLLMQSMLQLTGMAFLQTDLKVNAPTVAGDTIHVEVEVTSTREISRPDRGIVTTKNVVMNQRGQEVMIYSPTRMIKRKQPGG